MTRHLLKLVVTAFACALLSGNSADIFAADRIWDGGGANDNWSTPINWDGDLTAPAGGDTLTFDGSLRLTPNNNLTADTIFTQLTFAPGAGSFTLGGNEITLGGNIVNSSPNAQIVNLPLLLNGNRSVSVDAGGQLTLGGVISGATFGITKSGAGTLTLGAANTYTGNTTLDGGTLAYTANNTAIQALNFGPTPVVTGTPPVVVVPASTNASTLDLTNANLTATSLTVQTNTSTANNIIIGAGKTLTVSGAFTVGPPVALNENVSGVVTNLNISGDSLVVNGGTNTMATGVGRSNAATGTDPAATVDMSANGGLNNFTYTGTTGEFRIGSGNGSGTVTLANVSNTITAAAVRVADSQIAGTGDNNARRSILHLGAGTNVLNSNTIVVGSGKSGGTIDFAAAATNGSVTIAGVTGGASTANITLGSSTSSTGSGDETQFLLAGHNASVQAGTVIVGRLAGGTNGSSGRANVTFDTGTFNATSLQLGVNATGTAPGVTVGTDTLVASRGNFTLGGANPDNTAATGVLNVSGQFFLNNRTNATATAGRSVAIFTINGGTANINTDILDASTTVSTTAGANLSTLTLSGGTLNMSNHNIGTLAAPITNINLNSGTLNNPGLISGSTINILPAVVINGSPSFAIANGGQLNATSGPVTFGTGANLSGGGTSGATINGDVIANSGSKILPGNATTTSTLTFSNNLTLNTGSTVKFKLTENPSFGNDQINVASGLNLSGTVNVEIGIAGLGPQIGNTYTLFNFGSLAGNQSNFNVIGPGSRTTFTILPTSGTGNTVQLSVGGTGPLALKWIGNVNNTWDLNTTANWRNPSANSDKFFQLDNVTFDDTSTNLNDVNLAGQFSPGGTTVSATRNYKFTGSGGIAGGGSLTKSGTGTLILATNNTYTGTTEIQSGTVQVGDGGTTGTLGSGAVNNEGTLIFNRSDAITVPNVINGGVGTVVKNGTGTVTLSGNNTFAGGLTINNGTVRLTTIGAPGTGTTNINAAGTLVVGAAHTNPITISGGAIGSGFGAATTPFTTADFTVNAGTSTLYTADPQNLATNGEMILTGTLRGSGNLDVLSGSNATSPDANPGLRLRGTATSDYSGTITLGHNVKGEIQSIQTTDLGTFSPAGTGKFVLVAGDAALGNTQNAATTANGYSEFNVRNNSLGNITFGNNVEISGTGLTLMNPLGTAPVNAVTTMGNLKIGGGQELGVFLNTGNAHVIEFPTVTLNGGTATFSPKTPGFGPTASIGSDIALGNVSQLVAGSGITMSGLRTLYINGTTSYTGPTTVNSGFLGGTGTINSTVTVNSAGALAPGSVASPIGALTTSAVNLNGSLRIDLDDGNVGVQDVLNVNGVLALSGATLNLNIAGTLSQSAYIIAHYGSLLGGTFSSFVGTPGNYTVDYNYLGGHQIALVQGAALLQGDWDRNGVTNSADIKAMLKALTDLNGYKAQNTLSDANLLTIGDIDVSGAVNNQDIQAMLNLVVGLGGGSVASVPEPTSIALGGFGFAALVLAALRKKRASV
jgi:fibronectin-binding autotransporter adhesin